MHVLMSCSEFRAMYRQTITCHQSQPNAQQRPAAHSDVCEGRVWGARKDQHTHPSLGRSAVLLALSETATHVRRVLFRRIVLC